jgi:hypothetical protein
MHTFQDDLGREWTLSLTVAGVKKIKSVLHVDLLAPPAADDEGPIARLTASPLEALDAICVLIEDQIRAANLNREAVEAAMGGKTLGASFTAFVAELEDFFHAFGQQMNRHNPNASDAGEQKTPAPPPESQIPTDGSSSIDSPESSDKTQTPTP